MKRLIMLMVMAALVAYSASALAGGMVLTRIADPVKDLDVSSLGLQAKGLGNGFCCKIGNDNEAAFVVRDFISGAEKYSYMFLAEPSCGCETGFYPEKIQMLVQFGPEDVPVTFDASASFEETQFDDAGMMIPGPEICTSPTFTGTITDPGVYVCEVPMRQAECVCAEWGWYYAITMNIETPLQSKPDLIVDAFPVGGTSFMDQGNGWYDMAGYQLPGELKMKTKIQCCSNPVADDETTWGSLKAQFR